MKKIMFIIVTLSLISTINIFAGQAKNISINSKVRGAMSGVRGSRNVLRQGIHSVNIGKNGRVRNISIKGRARNIRSMMRGSNNRLRQSVGNVRVR